MWFFFFSGEEGVKSNYQIPFHTKKNYIYLQVGAASAQHDLMSFEVLSFGRQSAVDQRTAFQQRIEHADQRALMVVPAQTEMLVVSRHVYHRPRWKKKYALVWYREFKKKKSLKKKNYFQNISP